MAEGIKAHLNGGPMDDQYMVVEHYTLHVARPVPLRLAALVRAEASELTIDIRDGTYQVRRTPAPFFEPVPHDMLGTVEFDWQGWR